MAIPDIGHIREPIDIGLDGHSMDPHQKSRYIDMVKVACLKFHQNNIKYK